jgi:hypothetical protein
MKQREKKNSVIKSSIHSNSEYSTSKNAVAGKESIDGTAPKEKVISSSQ